MVMERIIPCKVIIVPKLIEVYEGERRQE